MEEDCTMIALVRGGVVILCLSGLVVHLLGHKDTSLGVSIPSSVVINN